VSRSWSFAMRREINHLCSLAESLAESASCWRPILYSILLFLISLIPCLGLGLGLSLYQGLVVSVSVSVLSISILPLVLSTVDKSTTTSRQLENCTDRIHSISASRSNGTTDEIGIIVKSVSGSLWAVGALVLGSDGSLCHQIWWLYLIGAVFCFFFFFKKTPMDVATAPMTMTMTTTFFLVLMIFRLKSSSFTLFVVSRIIFISRFILSILG